MKRVDVLRSLTGSVIQGVVLMVDFNGEPINIDTSLAIRLYDYLDEDLCDPKAEQQETKAEKPMANVSKPMANVNKPVKKAVAGSEKREKIDMGKLIALAKAGRTREWIADDMGISVATVYNYLKKAREEGKL